MFRESHPLMLSTPSRDMNQKQLAIMKSSRSPITHFRGLVLTAPFVVYLFITDIALSLLLPLKRLTPHFVYETSSKLAWSVWSWIQLIFVCFNGARVSFSGDSLPEGEAAVVVANHVSWSDFYMIQALALKSGMLGRCRYFAKKQLRLVPFLGWGLWAMGMPMVSRNWLKDKTELDRVFSHTVRGKLPIWLISFSEATRFTKEKYEKSLQWCQETDRPQPKHLLYPRTKGFITTVQQLRKAPHVKAVYDFTISYQHGDKFQEAPTMWDTLSLPGLSDRLGYRFHVHARRYPIETLPEKDEDLATWLEQRWVEKGDLLEAQRLAWVSNGM